MTTKVTSPTFASIERDVANFQKAVAHKSNINADRLNKGLRQLEGKLSRYAGDKTKFLSLLYTFNKTREKVGMLLPKGSPFVFLPDYRQRPKALSAIILTLGKPPVKQADDCWRELVSKIGKQAEAVLKVKGINISPTAENIQFFTAYQRTFKEWPTPMQFVIHNYLVRLEKAFSQKTPAQLRNAAKDFCEFHDRIGFSLRDHICAHPELKAKYHALLEKVSKVSPSAIKVVLSKELLRLERTIKTKDLGSIIAEGQLVKDMFEPVLSDQMEKNFGIFTGVMTKGLLRAGLTLAGGLGNIFIANRYGFIPSLITGVAAQALFNYKKLSKESVKLGLVQGIFSYLTTIEIPLGRNYYTGVPTLLGAIGTTISAFQAGRAQGKSAAIPHVLSLAPMLWFGIGTKNSN